MAEEDAGAETELATNAETVPKARFREVLTERNELRRQLAAAPKSTDLEALQKQLAEARTGWESERSARAEDRALWDVGLTDSEGQDLARHYFGRMPDNDRKGVTLGDWLKGLREKPDAAPKGLRPYLESAAPEPPKGRAPAPPPSNGARPVAQGAAPAAGSYTVEQLRALRQAGRWDDYYAAIGKKKPGS